MSHNRNLGLTQRERLHLNLLRAADYKSLRYSEARGSRRVAWWLMFAVATWTFVMVVL